MTDAAAQRIAELEAELAGLRAEMQDFSYTVSHDLRASLRHILSYAQLVQEDAAHLLPPETRGFLDTISSSASHMGLLMDGLMEWSRLGTVALQAGAVALQPLLQELLAGLAQQHPDAHVDWQLQADLPSVQADAALLRAALLCLLDNALKFTAQKDLRCIAISALSGAPDGSNGVAPGMVRIAVQDNGAGFNPALQSKLFHPFARLHTSKQFPGMGMGLALTRKMAQRMGGQVQAQAALDAGCTVYLTLPAAGSRHGAAHCAICPA
jgi:light-regulated signal transduction histidine kinase (bacteriophytochrome)